MREAREREREKRERERRERERREREGEGGSEEGPILMSLYKKSGLRDLRLQPVQPRLLVKSRTNIAFKRLRSGGNRLFKELLLMPRQCLRTQHTTNCLPAWLLAAVQARAFDVRR